MRTVARAIRWIIWGAAAILAGAMKPVFFPEGGVSYALVALFLLGALAVLGIVIEKWLLARDCS